MHGVDLTRIESVESLYQLIEDAQAEIARREAEERQTLFVQLQAVATKYGTSVEDFLNLPATKAAGKKAAVKKAGPRAATPTKAVPAGPLLQTEPSGDAAGEVQI
jgi:hypothetical protein